MSFKEAINGRQRIENIHLSHEHNKFWDKFYKERVKPFALETNNPNVLDAYSRMVNGRNTDAFFTENNYVNK